MKVVARAVVVMEEEEKEGDEGIRSYSNHRNDYPAIYFVCKSSHVTPICCHTSCLSFTFY